MEAVGGRVGVHVDRQAGGVEQADSRGGPCVSGTTALAMPWPMNTRSWRTSGKPQQRAAAPRHGAVERDDAGEAFREGQAQAIGQRRALAEAGQVDALGVDVIVAAGLLDGPEDVVLDLACRPGRRGPSCRPAGRRRGAERLRARAGRCRCSCAGSGAAPGGGSAPRCRRGRARRPAADRGSSARSRSAGRSAPAGGRGEPAPRRCRTLPRAGTVRQERSVCGMSDPLCQRKRVMPMVAGPVRPSAQLASATPPFDSSDRAKSTIGGQRVSTRLSAPNSAKIKAFFARQATDCNGWVKYDGKSAKLTEWVRRVATVVDRAKRRGASTPAESSLRGGLAEPRATLISSRQNALLFQVLDQHAPPPPAARCWWRRWSARA